MNARHTHEQMVVDLKGHAPDRFRAEHAAEGSTETWRDSSERVVRDRAKALGWLDAAKAQLGPNEFRRRLCHFIPGLLALCGAAIPHPEPVAPILLVLTAVFCLAMVWTATRYQQTIRRPGEPNCLAAILGYAAAIVPLFILFPSQPELALAVTGIVAFGDGTATFVGMLAGGAKLPWNRKKSWAGTAAFVLSALPLATFIYWAGSVPHIRFEAAIICVGTAVIVAALAESLPLPYNDNLLVGAAGAATLILMHGVIVGWC